jgi:hypothetical protein
MKRIALTLLASAMAMAALAPLADEAAAGEWRRADVVAAYHAGWIPWNAPYCYTPYGVPTALVVPPTANAQTSWGWGVGRTQMSPIHHQFARPYPGDSGPDIREHYPTSPWPSHTNQFGIYYIRAPY